MKYYAVINGQQAGPLESAELVTTYPIKESTLVWCEGMSDLTPAGDVSEIAALIQPFPPKIEGNATIHKEASTPPPYGSGYQPPYSQPGYQQPGYNSGYRPAPSNPNIDMGKPYNWMGWAIFSTIFGLFFYILGGIPGILGIVYSSNAQSKYRMGDYVGAYKDNNVAKIATIIGICIATLIVIGLIAFFVGAYIVVLKS